MEEYRKIEEKKKQSSKCDKKSADSEASAKSANWLSASYFRQFSW